MQAAINIRSERPGDEPVIADVVQRAYADVAYSDHREHHMVDRLRDTEAFVPELSLLAETTDSAVGHILLTRAHIRGNDSAFPLVALAPLSVVPECQCRGVGTALVRAACAQAAALQFPSVLLVGVPKFFRRLGFEPLRRYPIRIPFAVREVNCMIMALMPGALDGVAGLVEYPTVWLDH